MKTDYTIILNKCSFSVYCNTPNSISMVKEFSKRFNTYMYVYNHKEKRKVKVLDRQYCAGNKFLNEYIFHIFYIKDFMWMLNKFGYGRDNIDIFENDKFKPNVLGVNFNYEKYILRDYQEMVNRQVTEHKDVYSMLIDHQTGFGKGIMSISSVCDINKSVGILILPKYIEKWVAELKQTTDVKDSDIAIIQGSKDLIAYMNLAKTGNYKAKFIIFSNRTISNYMRDYEECEDMCEFIYPVVPTEFTECFKLGILMIDEVHQEFYSVFKACLYFNVELILGMSATLTSEDPSKERYYNVLFPPNVRLSNLGHDKYIELHEVRYYIDNPKRIRCINNMGYNHILFEQSIMRHSVQIRNYVDMIKYYIKKTYIDRKEKGDKLLIFASSIDLCTLLTYTVKSIYQDLKVSRYVEDDPFENIVDSDIVISTVLSSGTAFDIPGLITVIQTISVKSKQANIQALGRLRKKDGKQMKYYQLFSKDIQKQNDYHKYRIDILGPRIKELYLEEYIKPI